MPSAVSGTNSGTTAGLGQGIDVTAFVTAALAGDQANIAQIQSQQTAINTQNTALTQITTELQALQSAAFSLGDPLGSLSSQAAKSSNSNIVGATASSTASSATHSVTVNSLATTSSYYTAPVLTSTTPLATGSFSFQVGSATPVNVTISSANNTLDGLASSINNLSAGVIASVVSDANGSRLALVSNTSGAPGDLTVPGNTTGLTFTKAVTGTNASLVVDGIPISSTSNTVTSAINGVTLSLVSAAPSSPVSITVSPDTSNATNALNAFVSAYNTAIKDINTQFQVTGNTVGGPLNADGSVREAQGSLLGAIAFSTPGNNGIVNLASLGINLNNDGTLSVDQSKLSSTLASNYSSVQNFLQNSSTGFAQNLSTSLNSLIASGSGSLSLDAQGLSSTSQSLSQTISDQQDAFNTKQQNLILVYSRVNATLQELPLLQQQLSQQLASIP
jgi:flagellar hook-associated protein 2